MKSWDELTELTERLRKSAIVKLLELTKHHNLKHLKKRQTQLGKDDLAKDFCTHVKKLVPKTKN